MKKLALIITSLIIGFFLSAQTTDTVSMDSTTADTAMQILSPENITASPIQRGDFILTISKMIYWNKYSSTFRIGITDLKVKYILEKYMDNKEIHGLPVELFFVNEQNTPRVNLIYVPQGGNKKIDVILQNYSGTNTVFVSENFEDRKKVDITLLKINNTYKIWINTPVINPKNVYILPQLKAYTIF